MNAIKKNFCQRLGISQRKGQNLINLADRAAWEQEQEHNGQPNQATQATEAVENAAQEAGLKVLWPGLYPVFCKDAQQIHLPE